MRRRSVDLPTRAAAGVETRLAELVAALSLGVDLGFGQPMEHVLRQCMIALLLFLEHVLSEDAKVVRLQNRMNGINRVVAHGCNCNRPTLTTLEAAGFSITKVEHGVLPKAPPFVRPLVLGIATPSSVRQPAPTY